MGLIARRSPSAAFERPPDHAFDVAVEYRLGILLAGGADPSLEALEVLRVLEPLKRRLDEAIDIGTERCDAARVGAERFADRVKVRLDERRWPSWPSTPPGQKDAAGRLALSRILIKLLNVL